MAKACKYGCGTQIEWNDAERKFYEEGTNTKHGYNRCADLLEKQGKPVNFPDKPNFQKKSFNKPFWKKSS